MNIIKKKTLQIFEKRFARKGQVIGIRSWNPATFYEIDLYLPDVDMNKWHAVQHMKCKVGAYTYRDYTPASWDAETNNCTLYIDAAHDGAGSKWAASLKPGDEICYLGIGSTSVKPNDCNSIFCLGDSSTIGHFFALEQLAGKNKVKGALVIESDSHRQEFNRYFETWIEAIPQTANDNIESLHNWLKAQHLNHSMVHLAGHVPMVVTLKKLIKAMPGFNGTVKAQGFWW